MKYLIAAIVIMAMMIGCGGQKDAPAMKSESHAGMQMAKAEASGEKLIYYTCPMESHKHIHSAEPGECGECNMKLVPGVITTEDKMEYWGCPMLIHSHIRHDAAGRCAECKMELKPMRLKQS